MNMQRNICYATIEENYRLFRRVQERGVAGTIGEGDVLLKLCWSKDMINIQYYSLIFMEAIKYYMVFYDPVHVCVL